MINKYRQDPYILFVLNLTYLHRAGLSLEQIAEICTARLMMGEQYGD